MRDRRWRGRRAGAVVALVLQLLLTATAGHLGAGAAAGAAAAAAAEDVTTARFRELAARARSDPAARRELVQVRRVDGVPVDIATALAGASEDEQRARLRTLADSTAAPAGSDAVTAREDAHRILESRRFKPAKTPRPFQGVLRRLGEWLRPIGRPFTGAWDAVSGPWWALPALAAAVMALGVAVAVRMVRRRTEAALAGGGGARRGRRQDPAALEREADQAAAAGDYDTAVRLLFRAGLLRLDAAGAVTLRPSLTTGELTRRVRSDDLRELAGAFEAVAYAGEHADATDVAAARSQWPRVLQDAARP